MSERGELRNSVEVGVSEGLGKSENSEGRE